VSGNVSELRPGRYVPPSPPSARVPLSAGRRLDVEAARQFLTELDARMGDDPSAARVAYVIGRLEGHAQSLLDVLDSITEVA
jgi:hypothetical protein